MLTYGVLLFACGTILVAIVLVLVRALIGPTVYDRILAVNALGTKTVILVAILSSITGRPEFLDVALLYALISFVVTVAILRYKEIGRLG